MDEVLEYVGSTKFKDIERAGGPAAQTLSNWKRGGKTRSPNTKTVQSALATIGCKIKIVRDNDGINHVSNLKK